MSKIPDTDTKAALQCTARQLFHELAMHHHHYLITQQLQDRDLPNLNPAHQSYYFRLVVSHNYAMLALTLCKIMEFHTAFRSYLPAGLRDELDQVNSRIARSRILEYRNKCVGHLFDSQTRQPIAPEAISSYWQALLDGQSEEEFRRWWWSTRQEHELTSVAGIMVRIAESCDEG